MNYRYLTDKELRELDVNKLYDLPQEHHGVRFTDSGMANFINVSLTNGSRVGYVTKDNGYWGRQPEGKDYYLLLRFMPSYGIDGDSRYVAYSESRNDEVPPSLASLAQDINASIKKFFCPEG